MSTWLVPRVELTSDQLRAVELHDTDHHLILGMPGSGKTQVLLHRAANLAARNRSKPGDFCILLYTKVLRDYIRSSLDLLELEEGAVSTYDGWCRAFHQKWISSHIPRDFDEVRASVASFVTKNPRCHDSLDFVLLDEGQDLDPTAIEVLTKVARHLTVFADPLQQIFGAGATEAQLLDKLGLKQQNVSLLGAYRNSPDVAKLASHFIGSREKREAYLRQVQPTSYGRQMPMLFVADNAYGEFDRLAAVVRQRVIEGERVGILTSTSKAAWRIGHELVERGLEVEMALPTPHKKLKSADFDTDTPKIATVHSAKGLTFDTVMLPHLVEQQWGWVDSSVRQRLLFVAIARATKWVYLSTVCDNPSNEMNALLEAAECGHLHIETEGAGDAKETVATASTAVEDLLL